MSRCREDRKFYKWLGRNVRMKFANRTWWRSSGKLFDSNCFLSLDPIPEFSTFQTFNIRSTDFPIIFNALSVHLTWQHSCCWFGSVPIAASERAINVPYSWGVMWCVLKYSNLYMKRPDCQKRCQKPIFIKRTSVFKRQTPLEETSSPLFWGLDGNLIYLFQQSFAPTKIAAPL